MSCVTCFLYFGRGVPTRQFLPSPQQDNSFHLPRSLFSPCYPALPEAILFSDSFSPNLPSSSRQQIEAVPVPLRFGLVLAPGAQKLKPFQGWEATNRRGFGAQSFVSRGEKVFCIQSWALLLICLTEIACFVWESQILSTDTGLKSVSESTNKIG